VQWGDVVGLESVELGGVAVAYAAGLFHRAKNLSDLQISAVCGIENTNYANRQTTLTIQITFHYIYVNKKKHPKEKSTRRLLSTPEALCESASGSPTQRQGVTVPLVREYRRRDGVNRQQPIVAVATHRHQRFFFHQYKH
jgi:hypothetical protein